MYKQMRSWRGREVSRASTTRVSAMRMWYTYALLVSGRLLLPRTDTQSVCILVYILSVCACLFRKLRNGACRALGIIGSHRRNGQMHEWNWWSNSGGTRNEYGTAIDWMRNILLVSTVKIDVTVMMTLALAQAITPLNPHTYTNYDLSDCGYVGRISEKLRYGNSMGMLIWVRRRLHSGLQTWFICNLSCVAD